MYTKPHTMWTYQYLLKFHHLHLMLRYISLFIAAIFLWKTLFFFYKTIYSSLEHQPVIFSSLNSFYVYKQHISFLLYKQNHWIHSKILHIRNNLHNRHYDLKKSQVKCAKTKKNEIGSKFLNEMPIPI